MSASAGFQEFLKDSLAPVGAISLRRMFGGAGIYCDGVFFAIVSDDSLFLKTDEAGRAAFEAEGMGPFAYLTKHGVVSLQSYFRIPERLLDDPEELADWARRAVAAARKAASAARLPGTRPKTKSRARRRSA